MKLELAKNLPLKLEVTPTLIVLGHHGIRKSCGAMVEAKAWTSHSQCPAHTEGITPQ